MPPEKAVRKRDELREAALTFNEAIAAADQIAPSVDTPLRGCREGSLAL